MIDYTKYGIRPGVMEAKPRGIAIRAWALQNASAELRGRYYRAGAPARNGGDTLVRDFIWDTNYLRPAVQAIYLFKKPAPAANPVDAFVQRYSGRGVDIDKAYGDQCMDLVQLYVRDVLKTPFLGGPNAIDCFNNYPRTHYARYANTPSGVPKKGDIMIWGSNVGPYGHIAIFLSGDVNGFRSFDQNWPIGSKSHIETHSYFGVLGWLRKK